MKVHTNEKEKVDKMGKEEKAEKGVWKEGKRTEKEKVKEEVKRMIDEAGKNRKFGVTCLICKVRTKTKAIINLY